jgi:uncharacterized membrane protein YjgN (DUF898 family)
MTEPAESGESEAAPPLLVPPPPAPPPPRPDPYPLAFTGTGGEYFRIWIVNLALTVLTLGVYSAWAKVRRLQFFYRHTRLAGSGFDYHGDPIAILKGRLVGLVLFGAYSAISYVRFGVAVAILAALALAVPWLMARSLMFRLHNSSYRGIRFRFSGSIRSAYWLFLVMPVLTLFSLFLAGPLWHHRIKRYQFANASFGRTPFGFSAKPGDFYVTYVLAFAVMFGFIMAMGAGLAVIGIGAALAAPANSTEVKASFVAIFTIMIFVGYLLAIVAMQAITAARIENIVWNGTQLAGHQFVSSLSARRVFWIQLTNLLATVFTIGLFRPFAQVRIARYVASVFVMVPVGPIEALAAADHQDVSAVGEEAMGFFDFDIGF